MEGVWKVPVNYIDTFSIYYDFPSAPIIPWMPRMLPPWRYRDSAGDGCLHHWFLAQGRSFLAFYPNLYGKARLYMTCSVPRLINGSNMFNVHGFDEGAFYGLVQQELRAFPWPGGRFGQPASFRGWQVSRADFFIMHFIPPGERGDYMDAYALLTLPRHRNARYGGTCYVNSSLRPDRKSGKVLRIYPKPQEAYDRHMGYADMPPAVGRRHEAYMQMDEDVVDAVRVEVMLRRGALRYQCRKRGVGTTAHDVLSQGFQEGVLSDMLAAAGLGLRILHRREYVRAANAIFKTGRTRANAKLLARQVRNGQAVTLSKGQAAFVRKVLRENGIHYITSPYRSLRPIVFP